MRRNADEKDMQVYCNCCGKQLKIKNGIVMEGVAPIRIAWDYFSSRDGDTHCFDLCEECYGRIIDTFSIPVEVVTRKELV
jgi:hypothetical protein